MKISEVSSSDLLQVDLSQSWNFFSSTPELRFERLTRLAKRLFDVPVAFVSLVQAPRFLFGAQEDCVLQRCLAFLAQSNICRDMLVVPDTVLDDRFQNHPLTIGQERVRFYAGCPIHVGNGDQLATLCLIDHRPRSLSTEEQILLRDLVNMAEQELLAMELATVDELTGLSNRRGFEAMAQHALSLCQRFDKPVALCYFDLDLFKQINDHYGHAEGDRALQDFSVLLTNNFRQSDIIARLGGDEFVALLPDTSAQNAEVALSFLERAVQQHNRLNERCYDLRYSAGFVAHSGTDATISELMRRADTVMYTNKKQRSHPLRRSFASLLSMMLPVQTRYGH